MFGAHFYHERVKKSVAVFGTLFNNLYVIRKDTSGDGISQVKVPISYAPRRKFLDRIRENADLDTGTKVAIKLPRMSFEIISIAYDSARQLQKTNNYVSGGVAAAFRNKFYSWTPYTIGFQLSIYAKTHDDALQIVEQIVPYFNPQYNLTIKPFDEYPEVKEDVPIALTGVTFTDDYEGTVESRRTIIYTLDFNMNVNFYGPVRSQAVITSSIANLFNIDAGLADSDIQIERITVNPTPSGVSADSDYGIQTLIDLTFDSA
jgi:hypothetical protein